jgi:hypothetical protein
MTMADDLLAQYRRTTGSNPVGKAVPTDSNEYVAFGVRDKVHRLRIRSLTAPVNSPGYNILLNVVYDGEQGTHFVLIYTVLMVLVRGKNLQKLIFAIENGHADYIQQFDPARWQKPTAADAAVIDSIEVKATDAKNAETEH